MNRGDLINILLEKTLLLILPSLVKSLNLSIGHFQIKYSFLRKYAPIVNIKNLFELNYCSNVIDNFLRTYKHLSNSEKIKLFHSGDPSSKTCSAMVYVELYKWYVDYYSLETE